jgi:hypothetical protein
MNKRLPQYVAVLLLLVHFQLPGQSIYVAANGNDTAAGSINNPLATVKAALRKARNLRRTNDPSVSSGVHIIIGNGIYTFTEPLYIRPEDGGTALSPVIIEAAPNAEPVFSGGSPIKGWQKLNKKISGLSGKAQQNIWVASVAGISGSLANFRQLWVNGIKATRAKNSNGDTMQRIQNWNKKEKTCMIPTPAFVLKDQNHMELFIHQWWAIAILRIKKMETMGDSTRLFFYEPESTIQSEHPWPAPWLSDETGNSAFLLTNAIQFLDEPGEWYLDIASQTLYYWPLEKESINQSEIIAPLLETIVNVEGSPEHPVTNIQFNGIRFQHTGWQRPSLQGHVPHQNGMYMTEAYKLKPKGTPKNPTLDNQAWIGRPAAAVTVNYAAEIGFDHCRFEHLAATGLDLHKGVQRPVVSGNLFKDIGGSAILNGVFSDAATEIHIPYIPEDIRDLSEGAFISNNLVTDATNEDWSCAGIGIGYTRNTRIIHNEIENVSNSGISMGWGWNPVKNSMKNNLIAGNRIHHFGKHNYDCGGIYTLSAQEHSVIKENVIDSVFKAPYAHLPSHWFYIYTDEGSSGFMVKDNWTPSEKYLQNANGPDNSWTNNGPQVDRSIKLNAGLLKENRNLQKEKTTGNLLQPINEEHKELIELVFPTGITPDLHKLKQLLQQNKADSNSIYQWQNHFVIYSLVNDMAVLQGRLKQNFPEATVKIFPDMFYQYSKQKHCIDTTVAKNWDHIILTANLVNDKKMQQAYLDYHATQFEKWPAISRGFCNAGFQELVLFRNGRQLVLVISIPKGENLDVLNPKTLENNPKMLEWNAIMAKFQEGLPGTPKGETWVFLKPVKN